MASGKWCSFCRGLNVLTLLSRPNWLFGAQTHLHIYIGYMSRRPLTLALLNKGFQLEEGSGFPASRKLHFSQNILGMLIQWIKGHLYHQFLKACMKMIWKDSNISANGRWCMKIHFRGRKCLNFCSQNIPQNLINNEWVLGKMRILHGTGDKPPTYTMKKLQRNHYIDMRWDNVVCRYRNKLSTTHSYK